MIYPWLMSAWQRMVALGEHLPHALLLVGPAGLGKRALADALAARVLCEAPLETGHACGHCVSCQWRLSGNHPDLFYLVPAAALDKGGEADENGKSEADEGKAKSSQIVIEQVRQVQAALNVTGYHSARRVVIVDPAEAMNVFTANALLKLLEEPPAGCLLILVSSMPRRLLPTIRSRCQQWLFAPPEPAVAQAWEAGRGVDASLLALCGGAPLAAHRLTEMGGTALLKRFIQDMAHAHIDPLGVAAQWESWLKSKEALAVGFDLTMLVSWFQRWVADLAVMRLGGQARFFPAHLAQLTAVVTLSSVGAVTNCYNETGQIRRVVQHPLNLRLVLEDMLLRYSRVAATPRTGAQI